MNRPVREIAASWRVPTISGDSKSGSAATWIGAQNDAGEFIQIGTTEDSGQGFGSALSYQAFWSDTALQFVPSDLGTVKAGSTVSVSMVQKGYGWTIKVLDKASGVNVTRAIDYGFDDRFTIAEWVQENPSSYSNGLPTIPYPKMANPTFTQLELNHEPPEMTLDDGLVLITSSGHFRVPTPYSGGSFTFNAPTNAQNRYLTDISGSDGAAVAFGSGLANWMRLDTAQKRSAIATFRQAISATASSMSGYSWPTSVRADLRKFVSGCQREATLLSAWSAKGGPLSGSTFESWYQSEDQRQNLAALASHALGLPPVT